MATFTNQATLSYNGVVTGSNIVTGEIVESLTAVKTAVSESYEAGGAVTYIISLVNASAAAVTGVTITDNLGAYSFGGQTLTPLTYRDGAVRYYANGVLQTAPAVTAGDSLVISGITVPANGNAVIAYTADINGYAPLAENSTITNTAAITAAGITTAITAEETITAQSRADIGIVKALSPQTTTRGSRIVYTFTISNYGSAALTAADNAVITDTFDPALSDITVTLDGAALTEGTGYTYDEATGAFAAAAGVLTVPAAQYSQNSATGEWTVSAGTAVLTISGIIQ